MYVNNNLYFVGNLFNEIYFQRKFSPMSSVGNWSVLNQPICPFRVNILLCSSHFDLSSELSQKSPGKWIQSLRSIRTPCMETPPRLHTRNLIKPAREPPPATTRDVWFAAHQPTTSATWTRHSDATQIPQTTDELPHPPPNHPILIITAAFKRAILKKDITLLKSCVKQYLHHLDTNLEFMKFDCSDLHASYLTAEDILTSHTAFSTPLPTSPPPSKRVPNPSASFKPPKLVIENWNGKAFDFYAWLASILHGFTLAQTDDPGKLHHTIQAIPLNKRGPLNHITDWDTFRVALIEEFGSINVFDREVNQLFNLLPRYESVQEVAKDLAPKIMSLQSNLKTMEQFHKLEHFHSVAITQSLIQNIIRP